MGPSLADEPDRPGAPARFGVGPLSRLAERLTNAGAIFLGHDTPVALGDYAAGPSHVLPTGGTARRASGLCANDFLKRTSLIYVDRDGTAAWPTAIRLLAAGRG